MIMKHIGFLSFGHWSSAPYSEVRSAADALLQSIDLAVAAEELGLDGAYFRVHHFARQLGSPFPLLAAIGARTKKIEIGTAVIDMRYENPMYMAEDAGAADIIAGGRLQLGISRGSPEQVMDGWRYFGYTPREGETEADMARRHAEVFLDLLKGEGFGQPNPRPMFPNPPGLLRLEPYSRGLRERIWWGSSSDATATWAAKLGMNLQSSTLKDDETGEPLHVQQRKQIEAYRQAWKEAGHQRQPRVSVSRSIFALVDDRDRAYFGREGRDEDKVGYIDANTRAIFGRSYAAEPDVLVKELAKDRGDRSRGYAAAHRAESVGRGLQRPRDREHPQVRRPATRVALTSPGIPFQRGTNESSLSGFERVRSDHGLSLQQSPHVRPPLTFVAVRFVPDERRERVPIQCHVAFRVSPVTLLTHIQGRGTAPPKKVLQDPRSRSTADRIACRCSSSRMTKRRERCFVI
jgi:alkanesulfonate monooxygenase SsuD/methylene tetrahydromethanopterin reductase-like flavin-dependent oxidoreductase (luciferase family)